MEILKTLKESIDRVPFGIRWLCRATKALVQVRPHRTFDLTNKRQFVWSGLTLVITGVTFVWGIAHCIWLCLVAR